VTSGEQDHVAWVRGLSASDAAALTDWLAAIVADVAGQAAA
jgi:hypothetical protein